MSRAFITILTVGLLACGGSRSTPGAATGGGARAGDEGGNAPDEPIATDEPARKSHDAGEFDINEADESSRPEGAKLEATDTEAAVRFVVVNKDTGPIPGIVISLTSPTGEKYYTEETDADGFAEVLLPIGKTYELVYLSLGRRDVAAKVEVSNKPRLNLKLTMRYKREEPARAELPAETGPTEPPPRFVLSGVQFETAKATLTSDSYERLDAVLEYMTYKPSANIEISGHTDDVGKKKDNKKLSQKRANAVRDYLVSKGIDAGRIQAVGYGDEMPIAPNDTEEGRQQNRRIEATEL